MSWLNVHCSLKGGKSLVIVLGQPVLMSEEGVAVCKVGAYLEIENTSSK